MFSSDTGARLRAYALIGPSHARDPAWIAVGAKSTQIGPRLIERVFRAQVGSRVDDKRTVRNPAAMGDEVSDGVASSLDPGARVQNLARIGTLRPACRTTESQ